MRLTIIEPHADDAFLSLHGHVMRWLEQGHAVTIRTIHGDERRLGEAAKYAEIVGCHWTTEPTECDQLVVPLGITHPEHVTCHQQFETPESWFYLDMPYALVQKNVEEVNERLQGMTVISYLKPHANKWRHLGVFESQRSYFSHFKRAERFKPAAFELVLKGKS